MLRTLLARLGELVIADEKRVVLRNERTKTDLRYLSVTRSKNGGLVIEGQDLGAGVEAAFRCREYEWTWTIEDSELPKLEKALGVKSNLLRALGKKFSGTAAAQLGSFLDDNKIAYKGWSRIGD